MEKSLTVEEKIDWLQLIRTPNIGPITFYRLIQKFETAASALEKLPEFSRQSGRKKPLLPAKRHDAEREFKQARRLGITLLAACEPEYPTPLKSIADPPPILYAKGHINLFNKPAVAIIGARNASATGLKMARTLATDLGQAGIVVVSGLARGIDGAAHAASLGSGTIAVVAGSVDHIYPPEHDELTHNIAKQGTIISERSIGAQPTSRDFPRRNRLIPGLSRGVIIIEAAAKSGTLITARYALEQGREVFAVPGSPLDPRSKGANSLLRDGATLVETASDILDVLANQSHRLKEGEQNDLFADVAFSRPNDGSESDTIAREFSIDTEKLRREIYDLLSYTPLHRDEILRNHGAPPSYIADALLSLTLSGHIAESGGGTFIRLNETSE